MTKTLKTAIWITCFVYLLGCRDDDSSEDNGQPDASSSSGTGGESDDSGSSGTGGESNDSGTSGTGGDTDAGVDSGEEPGPEDPVDRSHLSDVGTTDSLDYSDTALWVCHPEIDGDFCEYDIDATEVLSDGSYQIVQHEPAEDPEFDCFYVYPTVLLTGAPQQVDFSDISIVSDPILSQAAPFTRLCRIYAPLYRQIGLSPGTGQPVEGGDSALALQDVKDAFAYYMENLNQDRDFVLIGHSQGTMMLTALIQDEVDDDPELQEQMISALLLGGRITVAEGELTGGTFQNIPICSTEGETGCVVAYVSFAKEAPPGDNARFGSTTEEGQEIACTNPALLAGNSGPFQGSYMRTSVRNESFAPNEPLPEDIATPFALFREVIQGECVNKDGYSYLEISLNPDLDEGRPTPSYRSDLIESIGMGLHLVDFNLPLGDLIAMIEKQAAAMP